MSASILDGPYRIGLVGEGGVSTGRLACCGGNTVVRVETKHGWDSIEAIGRRECGGSGDGGSGGSGGGYMLANTASSSCT